MKILEKRFYFLVPYNISPEQKGIQAGHAALKYAHKYPKQFNEAMNNNHEKWIVLNGGTTNNSMDYERSGSLDVSLRQLIEHNIPFSSFYEPDLNDALTAVCLLVDERVYNRKDYPDFKDWVLNENVKQHLPIGSIDKVTDKLLNQYLKDVGITKDIYILKELLNTKKLA